MKHHIGLVTLNRLHDMMLQIISFEIILSVLIANSVFF